MPEAPALEPAADTARARSALWFGLGLLLLCALLFSLHNTLARLAFDEGVEPTTVNAARTWAVLILFVLAFGTKGEWPRVPRAAWLIFAITAVCYSVHNPLLLVAFKFIPVSLAVLVMYVFPLIVAFPAAALGQERLALSTLAAAAVAFVGVALVLEIGHVTLDWRGLALALVTAFALAGNVVGAAQLNRYIKPLAVPFALSILGAAVFGAIMLADGGPTLPVSTRGWLIFAAATLASPAALIGFYVALPRVGAPRSSVVLNIEPVYTVLFGMWLLGETMSEIQAAGAVLIIGAIAVAALARLRAARAAEAAVRRPT